MGLITLFPSKKNTNTCVTDCTFGFLLCVSKIEALQRLGHPVVPFHINQLSKKKEIKTQQHILLINGFLLCFSFSTYMVILNTETV